ncbi:MAG: hypothetical protein JXQ75_04610 [Phycisphaerae bacterium]|nr:hypothetical protein [Phycisphaerae bacterium]
MPRPWTLRVGAIPELDDSFFPVRVSRLDRGTARAFRVDLAHVSPEQEGRVHNLRMPTSIHPGSLTAHFFAACGFTVEVDAEFQPKKALGVTLLARFERDPNTEDYRAVDFKPLEEDKADGK